MRQRRTGKRGGFHRLGDLDLRQVELPARRSRELELALAWKRIAGDLLSRNSRVTGVRRGILDIQVADRRWERAIRPMLPGLAGRMSAACPGFRIRKCRLFLAGPDGSIDRRDEIAVEPAGDAGIDRAGPAPEERDRDRTPPPDPREIAERYLRNAARRRDRG